MLDTCLSPSLMDPDALFVVRRLQQHRHIAYIVGGAIRDLLLDITPKDFDVVTSAIPAEICKLFSYTRLIGHRFKLVHVVFRNNQKIIETSTFRRTPPIVKTPDQEASLLIRNDNVYGTPEEDAFRRDFTVNGLFYDPITNQIIDLVDGMTDIRSRTLRTIGDPDIRFQEDPVRILRAIRFAAKLKFTIEPQTWHFMRIHRERIRQSSPRRVMDETWKLLLCGAATHTVALAHELGIWQLLAPEIAPFFDDERFHGIIMSLLRSFDAAPPQEKHFAPILLAPILLYGVSEAFWDHLQAPWHQRVEYFKEFIQQINPLLICYGFSRKQRAILHILLGTVLRLGHPEKPERVPPKVYSRKFFEPAFQLWQWVWKARGIPEELLSLSCEPMIQSPYKKHSRYRQRHTPRTANQESSL